MSDDPLLSVRGLEKHFRTNEGVLGRAAETVRAVDGISFDVYRGETFGLVGETGCGKSTAARTLLRLEEPTAGTTTFDGEPVTEYGPSALKRFRRQAQMIFQDPTSSFDPRMTIGASVAEPLAAHGLSDRERRRELAEAMLAQVGLDAGTLDRYPHELSGGQKQRAGLARALIVNPRLLVADEPVSALDVSVQAEILALLDELQDAFDLSILLITHDMNVVREVCDRVGVMYLGELVETGPTETILEDPKHPYTRSLVASIPTLDPNDPRREQPLSGDVPDPSDPPPGCRFHTRCPEVIPPEEYDLAPAEWRAVLDLRLALEAGELDREILQQPIEAGGSATASERETDRRDWIRDRYDVPAALSDADAEAVLAAAVAELEAGDPEAATDRLRAEFETVCRERHPELQDAEPDRPVACHLHH